MRLQIEAGDDAAKEYVNLVILARLNEKTDKYGGRYVLKITYARRRERFERPNQRMRRGIIRTAAQLTSP